MKCHKIQTNKPDMEVCFSFHSYTLQRVNEKDWLIAPSFFTTKSIKKSFALMGIFLFNAKSCLYTHILTHVYIYVYIHTSLALSLSLSLSISLSLSQSHTINPYLASYLAGLIGCITYPHITAVNTSLVAHPYAEVHKRMPLNLTLIIFLHTVKWLVGWLVSLFLWLINLCTLFNAKSIFMQIAIFQTIQFSMSTRFNYQKHFYFKLFSLFK